jgi:hypothetical protein
MGGQYFLVSAVLIGIAFLLLQSSGVASGDGASGLGGGVTTLPLNAKISQLAQAIATAEGYGVPGAVPTRANNPGDLVNGDVGFGLANSAGVTVYGSYVDGLSALYHQLNLIFTGASEVYSTEMSFATFARIWTGGDNFSAWAQNVSALVGASPSTLLADWYNA